MAVTEIPAQTEVRSSRALVVALTPRGLVVPQLDDAPELVLDLAGLRLIETLAGGGVGQRLVAEVATRSGAEVTETEALFAELRSRRLVVPVAGGRAVPPEVLEPAPDVPVPAGELVLPSPVVFRASGGGFEYLDHDGRLLMRLGADDLITAASLRVPRSPDLAFDLAREELHDGQLDRRGFDDLVGRLVAVGLVVAFDPDDPVHAERTRKAEEMRTALQRQARVHTAFDHLEEARPESGLPRVIGVHTEWRSPPTSLGMVIAHAEARDGRSLADAYDFRPRLFWDHPRLEAAADGPPGVYLFSNYIWNREANMELSALVKRRQPDSITVHGGPDTPKYEGDLERFFVDHPHVDVAVRGEGEETFAELLTALRGHVGGSLDLSPLHDVPGLSFRAAEGIVRTPDRDRLVDLDVLPSPFLSGLFEGFTPAGDLGGAILETNRGCPYGCTFCDWGSATLSRIRKFDLDRVFAEIEWCAERGFGLALADANFGIFERDVAIAERVAELKQAFGYPRIVGNNYAKNTVKHLSRIIEILSDAGIVAEGKMSMQTMDTATLTTIRRKNIKVEKYDDLSTEFRSNRLPLSVELMMGLPGQTLDTLRNDLQECIGRDVRTTVFSTVLLPNSPMNDPDYRAENGIVARPGDYVRQTTSFTTAEWYEMRSIADSFLLAENFGVLRHVGRYVHAETGAREIDFYESLVRTVTEHHDAWPIMSVTFRNIPHLMVPPVSWHLFVEELKRYLLEQVGLRDDPALTTALRVQHALLPSRDRRFPVTLDLAHDYASWNRSVLKLRESGHRHDWSEHATPLREFGPGSFTVEDPFGVCSRSLGGSIWSLSWSSEWDFVSPVSRPRQRVVEAT